MSEQALTQFFTASRQYLFGLLPSQAVLLAPLPRRSH